MAQKIVQAYEKAGPQEAAKVYLEMEGLPRYIYASTFADPLSLTLFAGPAARGVSALGQAMRVASYRTPTLARLGTIAGTGLQKGVAPAVREMGDFPLTPLRLAVTKTPIGPAIRRVWEARPNILRKSPLSQAKTEYDVTVNAFGEAAPFITGEEYIRLLPYFGRSLRAAPPEIQKLWNDVLGRMESYRKYGAVAGKQTIFRPLSRMEYPTTGRVTPEEIDIWHHPMPSSRDLNPFELMLREYAFFSKRMPELFELTIEDVKPFEQHVKRWLARQPKIARHPAVPIEGMRPESLTERLVLVDPYGNMPPALHREIAKSNYVRLIATWLQRAHDQLDDALRNTSMFVGMRGFPTPSRFTGLEAIVFRIGVNQPRVDLQTRRVHNMILMSPWASLGDALWRQVPDAMQVNLQSIDREALTRHVSRDMVGILLHELAHNTFHDEDGLFRGLLHQLHGELAPTLEAATNDLTGHMRSIVDNELDRFYAHYKTMEELRRQPGVKEYLGDEYLFAETPGQISAGGRGLQPAQGGHVPIAPSSFEGLRAGAPGLGPGRPAYVQRGEGTYYSSGPAGPTNMGGAGGTAPRILGPESWPISQAARQRLQQLGPTIRQLAAGYTVDRQAAEAILGRLARSRGLPLPSTIEEGIATYRGRLNPQELAILQRIKESWPEDILSTELFPAVLSTLNRNKMRELGIKSPGTFSKLTSLWREQALIAPAWHILNLTDAIIKNALHHYAPTMDLMENLRSAFRAFRSGILEGYLESPSVLRMQERFGEVDKTGRAIVPNEIKMNYAALEGEVGKSLWEGVGTKGSRAMVGGLLGLLGGGPLGAAGGAAAGAYIPTLSKLNRLLAGAIEYSARSSAWMGEKMRFVERAVGDFSRQVEAAISQAIASGSSRLAPDSAQLAAAHLVAKRGHFSPQYVGQLLSMHGVDQQTINRLMHNWANILHQANQAGIEAANHIHFDYRGTNLAAIRFT